LAIYAKEQGYITHLDSNKQETSYSVFRKGTVTSYFLGLKFLPMSDECTVPVATVVCRSDFKTNRRVLVCSTALGGKRIEMIQFVDYIELRFPTQFEIIETPD
jgi:hypothetical protein